MYFLSEKQRKVAEYYKKQKRLLEGYSEMETIHVDGGLPGALTEVVFWFVSLCVCVFSY